MQVIEKPGEGLSRSYDVRVPAGELGAMLEARIAEITPTLRLKGFRPGKVPAAHVRRIYGKSLMGEVVEKTLSDTSRQVLDDHKLRIASQPDLKPRSDMAKVIAGGEDLAYELEVEVMPDFDPIDVASLKLTRPVYDPTEAEVDEALAELVAQNRTYEARKGKTAKAEPGDQVVIDFIGRIDGEVFEGGAADDVQVVLGASQFLPGFEEQLVGAAAGGEVTVATAFPDDYAVERLRGKSAEFEVKVKAVRAPKAAKADDALAERVGMADLKALRSALRGNLEGEYRGASRFKVKRALLDALDSAHDIALPARMVEAEFQSIWNQVEADKAKGVESPEDEGKSEETLRAEYRKIAERRVRLGLVLAEIGRRAEVTVSDQELTDGMRQEAMRYGEQAQQIFDLLRQNPAAQTQIRAPLYEEKVVDLILARATVADKAVSKEELLRDDELPEGFGGPATKSAKPKTARAKTAAKSAPAASAEAAEIQPAKAAKKTAKPTAKPASA